jgi:hypothetical protein
VSSFTPRSALIRAISSSKRAPGTPHTTSPNICTSRRYESHAKRGLLVLAARPSTDTSLSPRLRTVSIMPGIESRAPLRTDTSSGSSGSPSRRPARASSRAIASSTAAASPSGLARPPRM